MIAPQQAIILHLHLTELCGLRYTQPSQMMSRLRDMEPTEVGAYRLLTRLGRGGMADVFLASRRGLSGFTKLVVVKRMREDLTLGDKSQHYRELLLDEARLAARLQHPNIVQTFEASTDRELPYIAMEYLDGQPLDRVMAALIRSGRDIGPEIVLPSISDVLSGLDYMHNLTDFDDTPLAIVHRDVSPDNIFVTYQGEVKLLDFGVAKHAIASSVTELGVAKGKLGYMAPEQAERVKLDRRVDLFSTGVVLWECLAMQPLIADESHMIAVKKWLHEPFPLLSSVRPELDPVISTICERALERDRERRYETAAAMRDDIEKVIAAHSWSRGTLASVMQELFQEERKARAIQIKHAMSLLSSSDRSSGTVELRSAPSESPQAKSRLLGAWPVLRNKHVKQGLWVALALVAGLVSQLFVRKEPPVDVSASSMGALGQVPLAATTPKPKPEVVLRMCGSNTIGAELAPALVEAFLESKGGNGPMRQREESEFTRIGATLGDHPVAVDIRAQGTATAFVGLRNGDCDIGMASRAIEDAEASQLMKDELGDLRAPGCEHVIALDGIAVIVHPNNPLRSLDRRTLADIFTGKISNWGALGGARGPISLYARDNNSGTFDTFKHLVLGSEQLAPGAQRLAQSEALSDAVASDPSAIGFVGLAYVRAAKAVAVGESDSIPALPTQFTVATEDYLLSRRLYLYSLPKPRTKWVTEFVSFALSRNADQIAAKQLFVDLGIMASRPQCMGSCPRRYAAIAERAERLSVNFRFRERSNEPDSRGGHDLDRLAGFMLEHRRAKLLLLGFSDSTGSASANIRLSVERAQAIERELLLRGIHPVLVTGFGSELPVASNETDNGRQRNRRVEAWIELEGQNSL